jgi:hypothetical protein
MRGVLPKLIENTGHILGLHCKYDCAAPFSQVRNTCAAVNLILGPEIFRSGFDYIKYANLIGTRYGSSDQSLNQGFSHVAAADETYS